MNNGINYQPQQVNAGFQPSTVFFAQQPLVFYHKKRTKTHLGHLLVGEVETRTMGHGGPLEAEQPSTAQALGLDSEENSDEEDLTQLAAQMREEKVGVVLLVFGVCGV